MPPVHDTATGTNSAPGLQRNTTNNNKHHDQQQQWITILKHGRDRKQQQRHQQHHEQKHECQIVIPFI